MFELPAALVALLGTGPLALGAFALIVFLGRLRGRRQEPSHVSGKEPPGDPTLRAALAAARRAAQEEHRAWEVEFCRALGVPIPNYGDSYDLVADLRRIEQDLEVNGKLYGPDVVTYMQGRFAIGGPIRMHKDHPECACFQCDHERALLRNGKYLEGQS